MTLAKASQVSVGISFDDNVGLAEHKRDIRSDRIIEVQGQTTRDLSLPERGALTLTATARYNEFIDFGDLSHADLGIGVRYLWQPTLGYTAPWYAISADLVADHYPDSDIRRGRTLQLGAAVGKRFTDRITGRLSYRYSDRDPRETQVFDTEQHNLLSNLDYSFANGATVYANCSFARGDVVSIARPNAVIRAVADEIELDPAFGGSAVAGGGGGPGAESRYSAYQFDASVRQVELGFNYPLGAGTALDASTAYLDANGPRTLYNRLVIRSGLLHRF